MSLPVCPNCGSSAVRSGYPLDAGQNACTACGHTAAVATFHAERPTLPQRSGIVAALPDPIVSPKLAKRRRPVKHEPEPPQLVRANYWYLRD